METVLLVCGIITATAGAAAIVFKCYVWAQRIIEGIRCQLRTAILHTYYTCKDTKKIRQYEAENFDKNYHAYKALKGNSFIDEIYKRAHDEWEVET